MRRCGLFLIALLTVTGLSMAQGPEPAGPGFRYLVLVELAGGNDGLNTLVPFADPVYRSLRPTLALSQDEVVSLSPSLGLNKALTPLMELWNAGEMAVVQGVGYADQNRSHFRSIDIWETASDARQTLTQGWLASAVPLWSGRQGFLADGVVLGETRPGPLQGSPRVLRLRTVDSFLQQTKGLGVGPSLSRESSDLALWAESKALVADARDFLMASPGRPGTDGPAVGILPQFATASDLIHRGVPVPVFKLTLRGFDTHVNQRPDQDALLAELARGVADFRRDLGPLWSQVLVMTYSEFGRRVAENGSQGTDHGAASVAFLWGGQVRGGLYGTAPDLTRLVNGDLPFTEDYRRLWATGAAFLGLPWTPTKAVEPFPVFR